MDRWKTRSFVKKKELYQTFRALNEANEKRTEAICQELRDALEKWLVEGREHDDKNWKHCLESIKINERMTEVRFNELEKLIKMLLINSLCDEIEEVM